MRNIAFVLLSLCLILASCTTMMDRETCQSTNWEKVGFSEGRNGKKIQNFRADEAKCSGLGTPLSSDAYFAGYARGIKAYCTRANGLYVGSQGEEYHRQCPPSIESEFLLGYVTGKRDYDRKEIEQRRTNVFADSLTHANPAQCTFNSDCTIHRSCSFSKCGDSGKNCSFDSDCQIEGDCTFGECRY